MKSWLNPNPRKFLFGFTFALSALAMAQVAAPPAPASTTAQAAAAPTADSKVLQPLVDKLIKECGFNATICVYVEDVKTGKVLADTNGTKPLAPASNNKLVTTAAGLSLLGPDFKFSTSFFTNGPIENGALKGDLIVFGGGDPAISGRYQPDKNDITAVFRQWAKTLKEKGITRIEGNLVADDSFFDDVYFHPNWYAGERAEYYSAEISALSFNDNCVDINWDGTGTTDTKAGFTLNPVTNYLTFGSDVIIAPKGKSTERNYKRGATDNNITVSGNITVDSKALDSAAIHDGALYCVTIFKDVLKNEGIELVGKPIKTRGASVAGGASPLFVYTGTSMLTACETINLNSQNYFAECVLKTVGKVKGNEGSFTKGSELAMKFCKDAGIYSEGHRAVDGSGLSALNRVTGHQLVGILRYMDNHGLTDKWRGTLPQGEVRGSLKRRFVDRDGGKEVAKRIFGKTGLIGGVRSLSGIVTDAKGREMYYSIILNQLDNKDAPAGMKFIDTTAIELAKSSL